MGFFKRIAARRYEKLSIHLLKRRLKRGPGWYKTRHGFTVWIEPDDFMDRKFYLQRGEYYSIYRFFHQFIRPGDICMDVGAHKGYMSLVMARATGKNGHVYSFEPDPRARERLIQNCRKNDFHHVQVFEYAVGKEKGTAKFKLSSQLGWSSLHPNKEAEGTVVSEIDVEIRSIDQMIEKEEIKIDEGKLSFIKLDCEGGEPEALSGMVTLIKEQSPMLWIEINKGSLCAAGKDLPDITELLREMGYLFFLPSMESKKKNRKLRMDPFLDVPLEESSVFDVVAVNKSSPEGIESIR